MKQTLVRAALVAAFACATAGAQETLRPSERQPASVDTEAPAPASKLKSRSAKTSVRLQRRPDGAVSSASGFLTRSYPGATQDAAKAFVAEYNDLLGGVSVDSLKPIGARTLRSRTYVRYQQQLQGVPVRGAHLVVEVNSNNTVEAFQSRLESKLQIKGDWNLDAAAAEERAVAGMNPSAPARSDRLWVVRKGEAIPVWRVLFRSGNPAGDWEVLVSAVDGALLDKQNVRMGADALGYAFPRNPIRGVLEQVALGNLISDTYLLSPQTKIYTYLPALRGQVEPNTVVQGAKRRDGNFLYNTDDARFSEVQLYWGMEAASARFAALGFWGFDEPLPGTVLWQDYDSAQKRFVGKDNAFFTPYGFADRGGMFFYLTSRNGDTSLDTDVIFHEYAHAVINELVGPDQSPSFKALNEGSADYFSSSFLDDPVMAEYAAKIFNSRNSFLRRTDNQNRWPYNVVGEVHADGNIWSGALWDIRHRLGAAVADDIAINTLAMLSPTAEFFDAASAAITAAEELYGAQAAETVAQAMESRGLFTAAARTASRSITLQSGSHSEGNIAAARSGKLLVGAQQYRIEVPNRATRLTVRVQADAAVRFYLRYRVPITVEDGFIVAEQVSDTGASVAGSLTLENLPELQAGTYYIAVVNTETAPVRYDVQAEVVDGNPAGPPALTRIENGGFAEGSVPAGPFLASRQFAVQVPEGYRALAVRLEGDQDVDLYVRYGQPVRINGTGFPEADVVSESEYAREDIRVVNQEGGALPAGIYVIAVYNYSQETARFVVRARLED
jgi:Zn-dependent metalloprotease